MEYTLEDRGKLIIEECLSSTWTDPIKLFVHISNKDFIRTHGPEHHILDGACLLTAFYVAGGKINLENALQTLLSEGLRMPGATCGRWGICGAVTSFGAALAIIDGTDPLSTDGTWGKHMEFSSLALKQLALVNGPRCCKRDAFLSFIEVIRFVNSNYDVKLPIISSIECVFSHKNEQCIKNRCPFYREENATP